MRLQDYTNGKRSISDELINLGISNKYLAECMKAESFVYRGSLKNIDDYQYIVPNAKRKPLGMSEASQEILDKLFNKKFGWNARSEGVFAIGDINGAKDFGNAYIFIPESDNFKFVWSPKIYDINVNDDFNKLEHEIMMAKPFDKVNINIDDYSKEFEIFVNTYKDNNLSTAIKFKHEISFKLSNGYYLVNMRYHSELKKDLLRLIR